MKRLIPTATLLDPIHYMELEGHDCRIAVHKAKDFLKTLGDANLSMTYANCKEYKCPSDREQLYVRRIHLRHAILDLNSCYDLLLQIPWFYYRVWEYYNFRGKLRTDKIKFQNKEDIRRNTQHWVIKAEECCSAEKLNRFFNSEEEHLQLKQKFSHFYRTQINYKNTSTIRKLANQIKHNHNINFKELQEKPSFKLKINEFDLPENKSLMIGSEFYELGNPEKVLGKIEMKYTDDFYFDIHYKDGDSFYAKDYLNKDRIYSMDEVYDKLLDFHEGILDLYNCIIDDMKPKLQLNNLVNEPRTTSTNKINMDRYFKPNS